MKNEGGSPDTLPKENNMAISEKGKEEFLAVLRGSKSVMSNSYRFTDEEFNAAVEIAIYQLLGLDDPGQIGDDVDITIFKEILNQYLVEIRGY